MRPLLTLQTLIVCAASTGYGSAQDNAEELKSIAVALSNRQYRDAADLARKAARKSPRDVRVLTFLGVALVNLGDDDGARDALGKALKIDPGFIPALEAASRLEYKADSDRVIPLLDRLLAKQPADETSHMMRAVIAARRDDCTTAVEHFSRSPKLLPSQPRAIELYAVCLARTRKLGPAASELDRLIAIEPSNDRHRYRLAAVQLMAGDNRKSLDTLRPLLEREPPDSTASGLASTAWESLGDTPRAVQALREAIAQSPDNVQFYVDLTSLCIAHRSFPAGLEVVNAGLARHPDSPELHLARGALFLTLSDFEKADADFASTDRLDSKQAGSSVAFVLEKLRQGDLSGALTVIDERLERHPEDAYLLYLRADTLVRNGATPGTREFMLATQSALRATELKPGFPEARNLLSRLYLAAGKTDQAIAQCRLALRDNPSDEVALYRLIRALQSTGSASDAEEVPGLRRRFADAREKARVEAAGETSYRLMIK